VHFPLLRALAPLLPAFADGAGKRALAAAPSRPLPEAVTARRKAGFGVPMGAWLGAAGAPRHASRRWAARVLAAFGHAPRLAL
jgi:asparagine synthase (glutamine-hydrolysing)